MAESTVYTQIKCEVKRFYLNAIKRQSNRVNSAALLNKFMEKIDAKYQEHDNLHQQATQQKKNANLEIQDDFKSLKIVSSASRRNLDISRSKISRKSDSSKDKVDTDSQFFGIDWIYYSVDCSPSFIANDNSISFHFLEDRINDHLSENQHAITPIMMMAVSKYWKNIVDLVTRPKSLKWQKTLKDVIEKMPLEFNRLIVLVVMGKQLDYSNGFTSQCASRLSKDGKVNIINFTLNCRQIQKVEREGNFGIELSIGYLRHRKAYVISNKSPQYSENELSQRQLKKFISTNVQQILGQYQNDETSLGLEEFSNFINEKEKLVKQFLNKRMALIKQGE